MVYEPGFGTFDSLRLACKTLSAAVTRSMLPRLEFTIDLHDRHEVVSFLEAIATPGEFQNAIRKFRLSFRPSETSIRVFDGLRGSESYPLDHIDSMFDQLPVVLSHPNMLLRLDVFFPTTESKYYGYQDDPNDYAPQYDLQRLKRVIGSLSKCFTEGRLQTLTDLRLSLPCTHNFLDLSRAMSEGLVTQLRHLYLAISDAAGPGGSKDYLIWADEDEDGDDGFPLSNLQEEFPNGEYAATVFNLAARCPNLESLGIVGTHVLDAESCAWTAHYPKLKSLLLKRIKISADRLRCLTVLPDRPAAEAQLSKVLLEEVFLDHGEWHDVFGWWVLYPALIYVHVQNLFYSRNGSSSHLAAWNGRPREDSREMWTEHAPDEDALAEVIRVVIKRAGGLGKYPNIHGGGPTWQPGELPGDLVEELQDWMPDCD